MQTYLGSELPKSLHVHHKNGDRYDNRLENLEVIDGREHARLHSPQILPLTKTCQQCGREFTPHPTKRRRAVGCSVECGRLLAAERRRKLNATQRTDVCVRWLRGESQVSLAASYGVTQASIWAILNDRSVCVQWIAERLARAVSC